MVFFLNTIGSAAFAEPDWVTSVPKPDAKFKYYVGRSSKAASQSEAFAEAYSDAVLQSIRDNFGFSTNVQTQVFETTNKSTVVQRVQEASRDIEFKDFEQVETYIEDDGRFSGWVLCRYLKEAIAHEKKRLLSQRNKPLSANTLFSIQGREIDATKGVIEIITQPPDAQVTIDGQPWGLSPLKLIGRLSIGEHRILLEHDSCEPVEEIFITGPNATLTIDKILVKSSGNLKITSNPPGASVLVNGKFSGVTPTEELKVIAGEPLRIELVHPESEKFTQETSVNRNELKSLDINLPLKPAFLSFKCLPKGVITSIHNRNVICPISKLKLEPGSYTLTFNKEGYATSSTTVKLHGGEVVTLPTIELQQNSVAEKEGQAVRETPLNLSLGGSGSNFGMKPGVDYAEGVPIRVSIEKQFKSRLGLRFWVSETSIDIKKSSGTYATTGGMATDYIKTAQVNLNSVSLGLPRYFSTWEHVFQGLESRNCSYIMPFYTYGQEKYHLTNAENSKSAVARNNGSRFQGIGLELGWWYFQNGPLHARLFSSFAEYESVGSDKSELAIKSEIASVGLDIGWTFGGIFK